MKLGTSLVLLSCIAVAWSASVPCTSARCGEGSGCKYTDGNNGRPACSAADINKTLRNNNDPTRYWICETVGSAGKSVQCPAGCFFQDSLGSCVDVGDWIWTVPCDPPNLAADSLSDSLTE